MNDLASINSLLRYSDQMNRLLFTAAGRVEEEKLWQSIDVGLGSLGRILVHICHGESVWLGRWQGKVETPWPIEAQRVAPHDLLVKLQQVWLERDAFMATLDASRLGASQPYRDSRGQLFQASLRDMILQGIIHSTHHRAQVVNALKRLGGGVVEVDYMHSVRRPA